KDLSSRPWCRPQGFPPTPAAVSAVEWMERTIRHTQRLARKKTQRREVGTNSFLGISMRWDSLHPAPLGGLALGLPATPGPAEDKPPKPAPVDPSSLQRKLLCGYQGWFRCPGDAADQGWIHWSRDSRRLTTDTLTFEMWPDLTEYTPTERFPALGFRYPDG